MNTRLYRLVLLVLACLFALALPALAQEAVESPGLPTGGLELGSLILGIVLGVGLLILGRIAPLTKNTVDDRALEILKGAAPTIQKWLDPKDPSVPPSPTNPTGKA